MTPLSSGKPKLFTVSDKSIQFRSDQEALLDLRRFHTEFKVLQSFLRFLVGSHGNTEMKSFPVSLCPPLPLFLALCAGFDWPFGNCCSCLGCLTVAPICSDYMHTEWTWCGTGWLPVTNVLWHYPRQPFCFQGCLFSHSFIS